MLHSEKSNLTQWFGNLMLSWRTALQENYQVFLVIALGVVIRLAMIPLVANTPYRPVDVYDVDGQAAKLILDFKNPYFHAYTVHGYQLDVFAYLPLVPIYYAPFYLLGDIRYGNVFADILIMISTYWIAKSIHRGKAIYAPFAYAIFPISVWLTSAAGTNIMVGTAFLMLSVAGLLQKKYSVAAIFLGLGIAANQLVILALPLLGYYYWKERKLSHFVITAVVSAGIILPFFLAGPSRFTYDVLMFQFVRPLQSDGLFSLYSIVNAVSGIRLSAWIRAVIFLVPAGGAVAWLGRKPGLLIPFVGILLFLGAFVLPVNGFWNYFLPAFAVSIGLIPNIVDEINQRTARVKRKPRLFRLVASGRFGR